MVKPFLLSHSSVVALCLLLLAPTVRAEDATKLVERLHTADIGTALDTPGLKPWHLKMTVQLFDEKGKPSDEGTIEEWWSSSDLDRREYITNGYKATEIRHGATVYRTKGADLPSFYLEKLREQVVHPIPPTRPDAPPIKPDLRKLNVGKVALECISLRPAKGEWNAPLGSSPAYCLDAGTDSLRMTVFLTSLAIARNSIGRFQGREVSVDVLVSANNTKTASEHVDSLVAQAIPQSEFALTEDIAEVVPPIMLVDGAAMTVAAISQKQPIYPTEAKENHIAGSVIMRAIIGTNGNIRDLQLISSNDAGLARSAMSAVRQWTYKPFVREWPARGSGNYDCRELYVWAAVTSNIAI